MQSDIELKPYTTFRIGGPAAFFAAVRSEMELHDALRFAEIQKVPWRVLGGGSNVLISDVGYHGLIIRMEIRGRKWEEVLNGVLLTARAGELWDDIVRESISRGFSGLENLSFIPGTVGAAPIQNIGAYGVEVKDVIERVEVLDTRDGTPKTFSADACAFGYRDSIFKRAPHLIILSVTFRLSREGKPNLSYKDLREYFGASMSPALQEIRTAVRIIRSRKFPDLTRLGTAGSYFRNPFLGAAEAAVLLRRYPALPYFPLSDGRVKIALAWLLDNTLHLKGARVGDVGLFERQPLVLVNYGTARASDVMRFADDVTKRVRTAIGISIEPEVMHFL